jgi:hypothetical protein
VTDATATVADGVIHGASSVGAHLGHAAKGTVIGVLRATEHTGNAAIVTIGHTAHSLIHGTAAVDGDLEPAATGAVEGAIHVSKDVGVKAEDAASAAAHGALRAAGEVGSATLKTVRNTIKQTTGGVKVVLKAPFDKEDK